MIVAAVRRIPRATSDEGAGSILVMAIMAATLATMVVLLPIGALLVVRQQAAGAADSAALAAADVAAGLRAGSPCPAASLAAEANAASVTACSVEGPVATVRVRVVAGPVSAESTATAGPPALRSTADAPG